MTVPTCFDEARPFDPWGICELGGTNISAATLDRAMGVRGIVLQTPAANDVPSAET